MTNNDLLPGDWQDVSSWSGSDWHWMVNVEFDEDAGTTDYGDNWRSIRMAGGPEPSDPLGKAHAPKWRVELYPHPRHGDAADELYESRSEAARQVYRWMAQYPDGTTQDETE